MWQCVGILFGLRSQDNMAQLYNVGAHSLQSLAVSGCTVNLVIFLLDMMDEDNASASNIVTNWIGTSFLMSVIGASIGDSSVGHMWASVVYHILFVMVSCNNILCALIYLRHLDGAI